MIVVSDNSPLQYLILIGCIDVLPSLYGQVLTTPQVIAELRHEGSPDAIRDWADSPPDWLRVELPADVSFLDTLDLGEASAISLAEERHAELLLIDERAGSDVAKTVGIPTVGTLGVLIDAGLERLIDFDDALERLTTQTPFYYSNSLIQAARRIFRERRSELE